MLIPCTTAGHFVPACGNSPAQARIPLKRGFIRGFRIGSTEIKARKEIHMGRGQRKWVKHQGACKFHHHFGDWHFWGTDIPD